MATQNLGLTDAPIRNLLQDSLGTLNYVDALSRFIIECQTPMTISIQGDWGTGKTSMMYLVQDKLNHTKNKKIETLWFNTWQFSQFDMQNDLPISLLSNFSRNLGEHGKETIKKILKTRLIPSMGKVGKTLTDIVTGVGGDFVEKVISKLSEDDFDVSQQIQELKSGISKAVSEKLSKSNSDRLVVFVDDLDRLLPEKAVELLEVIKLFLDVEKCVFVLAVDYNVVAKGLEKKFGISIKEFHGKNFFDKIIQLPFNLPVAHYDVRKYFKDLLDKIGFEGCDEDLDIYIRLAANSVGVNPRSIKRLFNSMQLLKMVAEKKEILKDDEIACIKDKNRILFAILCIQTAFEDFYRFLLKNKDGIDTEFFIQLRDEKALKKDQFIDVREELKLNTDKEIKRFTEFVRCFFEAIQLKTDDSENSDETLSETEIFNLKSIFSFSSLTASDTHGIEIVGGEGSKYERIVRKIIEELNQNFFPTEYYKKLDLKFSANINDWGFTIGTDIKIGILAFRLNGFLNNNAIGLAVSDNNLLNSSKYVVKDWCVRYLKTHFKDMEMNLRRNNDYIIFWQRKLDSFASDDFILKEYRDNFIRQAHVIFQKLSFFYDKKIYELNKIHRFINNLKTELEKQFPYQHGWLIENNANNLGKRDGIYIQRSDWNKKICLALEPEEFNFNLLFYGIKKGKWKEEFNKDSERVLREKFNEVCNCISTSSDWWISDNYLDDKFRYIVKNSFLEDNFQFIHDTMDAEKEFISNVLDVFIKMKSLKPMIDDMLRK